MGGNRSGGESELGVSRKFATETTQTSLYVIYVSYAENCSAGVWGSVRPTDAPVLLISVSHRP